MRSTAARTGAAASAATAITTMRQRKLRFRHHSDPSHFVTIFLGMLQIVFFDSDRTPNKRFEPLCSSVNTNCTGHTHTHTDRISHISQCFPFFKGATAKQPEGFGCFVCPNSLRPLACVCEVFDLLSSRQQECMALACHQGATVDPMRKPVAVVCCIIDTSNSNTPSECP